jgi:hypothetical protein
MKKAVYSIFILAAAWNFLTSTTIIDPVNPPMSSTGAPGEESCGKAKCHTKGTTTGAVEVTGIPAQVTPNTTYNITVKVTSTNAKTTGFQMTCLDGANTACGTFTGNTKVNVGSENARQYPRNSTKVAFTAGAATWTFAWKSPANLTNNAITFYYASLLGNGSGKEDADNVALGKTATKLSTATIDAVLDASVMIFPNPASEYLNIKLEGLNEAEGFLWDANGRMIKKMNLSNENQIFIKDIAKGNYLLQIWSGDKQTTRKVVIN